MLNSIFEFKQKNQRNSFSALGMGTVRMSRTIAANARWKQNRIGKKPDDKNQKWRKLDQNDIVGCRLIDPLHGLWYYNVPILFEPVTQFHTSSLVKCLSISRHSQI